MNDLYKQFEVIALIIDLDIKDETLFRAANEYRPRFDGTILEYLTQWGAWLKENEIVNNARSIT